MLRFSETKVTKEKFYAAKWAINFGDVNVDNIVISKLVKAKTNSKYLIEYLDKVIRPLFLILLKMSEYVETFKIQNNKLMSFRIDDERVLKKIKKKHFE